MASSKLHIFHAKSPASISDLSDADGAVAFLPLPNLRLPPAPPSAHPTFAESIKDPRFYYPSPMSYSDGEDGWDGFPELPHDASPHAGPSSLASSERNIRRRSSKACDQCRKSKCKCERSTPNEPCKNCIIIGTTCTFLGPSRKRGPPKGYIDAIEARLHQTEGLLGIILATTDGRAKSLLNDIAQDPLAKEIINRVDKSPYGVKGRRQKDVNINKVTPTSAPGTTITPADQDNREYLPDLRTVHPSNEWQDRVVNMINNLSSTLPQDYNSPKSEASEGNLSRRQRRRVGTEDYTLQSALDFSRSASECPGSRSSTASWYQSPSPAWDAGQQTATPFGFTEKTDAKISSTDSDAPNSNSEEELLSAVGQLSINEEKQIRYHGKASPLYLLRNQEKLDQRNADDIWRFPTASLWPQVTFSRALKDADFGVELPPKEVQNHMLNLYFTYVHPWLPIIHKQSFLEAFRDGSQRQSPGDPAIDNRRRDVSVLLLLAMFACASRHDSVKMPVTSDPSGKWSAGNEYLERAQVVLNLTYSSSRPATVQALLLMGYRESGIGHMCLAWTYVGMAIRMAQDLGMHRRADGWKRNGLGGRLFSEWELAERKRTWFGCVVMDKYISAFIGRPIMIFDPDFDTLLPSLDDLEEDEEWSVEMADGELSSPVPGRMISCFNALAVLLGIFGRIMQLLFTVQQSADQKAEAAILEKALDKWYLDLPDHLQYDIVQAGSPLSSKPNKPLPNVLGLHIYYWTTVILLHRPFIAHLLHRREKNIDDKGPEGRARISRGYELCRTAAIHIASLTSLYKETYLLRRCSPLLVYCLFSSNVILVADMARHPGDPQARISFAKVVSGLDAMGVVWHSATRALGLFTGAKTEVADQSMVELTTRESTKRAAEDDLDDARGTVHSTLSHPPASRVGQVPNFAPKPRIAVPAVQNPQRQYSQAAPAAAGGFTGGQNYMAARIQNASSPLASELDDPSYMVDPNMFGTQLSTAVIPQLYSSGFLDDVEYPAVHGMPSAQQVQELQPYRGGAYSTQPPPQMISQMGHYEMQPGAVPPYISLAQHPQIHQYPQHQRQQQPRMGALRSGGQQQQQPDVYLPQRFNLYM